MSDDPIFHSAACRWQEVKCRSVFQARFLIIFDSPYDCFASVIILLLLGTSSGGWTGVTCRLTKFESARQCFTMPQFSSPLEIEFILGIFILSSIIVLLICFLGCLQTRDNNPCRSWLIDNIYDMCFFVWINSIRMHQFTCTFPVT